MSQEPPETCPRAPPARFVGARGGLGPLGRRAPASSGTAWIQPACCWCVLVCVLCVRLCMTCASVPPSTPKLPADRVLVLGTGCPVVCAMAREKTLRVHILGWYLCTGAPQWARSTVPGPRRPAGSAGGRLLLPAAVTLFLCLSFSLCAKRFLTSHSFAKPSRLYS